MATALVYIPCKNKKEARNIAQALLKEHLIACANIISKMESVYRWKGKMCKTRESLLLCKTRKELMSKVETRVKEMHSYTVPCIEFIEIKKSNKGYLKWVLKETQKGKE